MRDLLRIGEVAQLLGVATNTVRYYHKVGLLPEPVRTEGGYRLYDAGDILTLRRILQFRFLGLTIRQIANVVDKSQDEDETLQEALEATKEELSARITELQERRERVEGVLSGNEELETLRPPPEWLSGDLADELTEDWPPEDPTAERFLRKFGGVLGGFRWPARYVGFISDMLAESRNLLEMYPGSDEPTKIIMDRFLALYESPEDSSEVERLVEDYLQYERDYPVPEEQLDTFWRSLFDRNNIPVGDPFLKLIGKIVLSTFSPAQRRAFSLLEERKKELYGEESPGFLAEAVEEHFEDPKQPNGGRIGYRETS